MKGERALGLAPYLPHLPRTLSSLPSWDTSHSVPVLAGHHQSRRSRVPSPNGTEITTWPSSSPNNILLPLPLTDTLSPDRYGAEPSRWPEYDRRLQVGLVLR